MVTQRPEVESVMSMTSRERILAALEHQQPDRVPVNYYATRELEEQIRSRLNVPIELHPIPPSNVTPVLSNGVISGYWLRTGDGSEVFREREDVIRFYFPNPANPWASKGYLGPEATTADSLNFSGQHLKEHYRFDATPSSVLETAAGGTPPPEPGSDLAKRVDAAWRQAYHRISGAKKGIPIQLPEGVKLIQMAMQSGADIVPLLEFWRDEQLMGFGTPRSVLGQSESGDRSTAETNQYVFDRHAVKPVANLIEDAITLQLAPAFDPNIYVEFEQFISADKEFDLKKEDSRLKNKVTIINEVRKADSLEPVDYGDDPVGNFADVPYLPDVPGANAATVIADAEDRTRADDPPQEIERTAQARAAWARNEHYEKQWTPRYAEALRRVLKKQRVETIRRLYAMTPRARVTAAELFDVDAWADEYEAITRPVRTSAFNAIGSDTMTGLVEGDFNFTEAMERQIARQETAMIQFIDPTTQDNLARALSEATEAGESVGQIAKRIRGVFDDRAGLDAMRIARTETLKASQSAQLEGFGQSGVVTQIMWNTSLDGEVRDSHAGTEGQVVDMGDSFTLADGEAADAPGIGAGGGGLSAANTINCRCFVTPVLGE